MATLRQAIERHRERGAILQSDVVSVRSLHQNFYPVPAGSTRALLLTMLGSVSKHLPWAVILCRFKGEAPNPDLEGPIEQFYRGIFAPGTGGLVEYWRDVTLGAIDITGTKVFGWVEVEIPRSKAGGAPNSVPPGPGRTGLANYAVNALKRQEGENALNGFLGPIIVYTQNWSKDDVPAKATWKTPGFYQFWIDGSSDGKIVCLTPPHDGNITAHEMGHVFGMQHDVSADFITHYADPCCIMSQKNSFTHPFWKRNFGPAVCFPHLIQRDWMYSHRVFQDNGDWLSLPNGIALPLAPTSDPGARANLGIKLTYKKDATSWDYYLEYVKPIGWNQGLSNAFLFIRRIGPADVGPTPAILGSIIVPATIGTRAQFVEPSGNVRFQVERFDPEGRMVQVNAKKL